MLFTERIAKLWIFVKIYFDDPVEVLITTLHKKGIKPRVQNSLNFVKQTQVLPCIWKDVPIDFVFAHLPFEIEAIERATQKDMGGFLCRVTTAEDLIIQKFISQREKDWLDIQGIVKHQKTKLDTRYILKYTEEIANWMGTSKKYDDLRKLL